tara:strand:+ start:11423 stop:11746 length:324 start_codon:yes stop_codon:yes gene_type:complete
MIDQIKIKEQQNIFDALLGAGGTIVDAISLLIAANDDSFQWFPQTESVFDRGTVADLDFVVLSAYKKNNHVPVNRMSWFAEDPTDFQDTPTSSGIGSGVIGSNFIVA